MKEYLYISDRITEKLISKHGINPLEVQKVWELYVGIILGDSREQHRTNPPTGWFLVIHSKRLLKVVFVIDDDNTAYLKTAFYPLHPGVHKSIFLSKGGKL